MGDDNPTNRNVERLRAIQNGFFLALLLGVSGAFVWLIATFLQPVFWATVLAVLFQPVQQHLTDRTGGRARLAAVLTIVLILCLVFLPLTLIGIALSREAADLYERISNGNSLEETLVTVQNALPFVDQFLNRFGTDLEGLRQRLSESAIGVSQFLASRAVELGQDALRVGLYFFLMLYLLFFFLKDGRQMVSRTIEGLPLGRGRERALVNRFAQVSRATIKATLIVGVVQGTIGGLIFWILGIRAAVFWGVIMTIVSILPAVGSGLVWGPAAIVFFASGDIWKGIALTLAGVLIIGLIDNVLRPILVGGDTRVPDYMILLSTLGGLATFGLSGFVIGPLIAALFLTLWEMFIREYGTNR
jgi:predicted PurR-regulated permease PerM